ncbi:MAG TPA: hypothetical protein VIN58_17375 [Roseateles sp.]
MIRYLANLPPGKMVLWCYLLWYAVTVAFHFDPSPQIWLNSVGISAVIGIALMLSVARGPALDRWQTFRLFAMPFCVSSFSSLIKGQGFVLILPPRAVELGAAVLACAGFVALVRFVKWRQRVVPVPKNCS